MPNAVNCRHCAAEMTLTLADLGVSPIANDYISEETAGMEPFYPLHVFVCENCWLAQVQDFLKADDIFREDYAYFSSVSASWLEHARLYVEGMSRRFGLGSNSQVVEIACNDGYLLQYVIGMGIPALGVEPCASVAQAASAKGIQTRVDFFGDKLAQDLVKEGFSADLMVANNVAAHVPDINDFLKGFATLLKPGGVATFEIQHLLRLMQNNQFDTIYHEHYSYLSVLSAQAVLATAGLRIFDVEHLESHGGSIRLFACHEGADFDEQPSVGQALEEEMAYGLKSKEVYQNWSKQVVETKQRLLQLLIDIKQEGKSIAGYGAPAKGNTLLNYCGIGQDFLDFTADRAPSKQGMRLPGTRIPIFSPDEIDRNKPDYILILPWNLSKEIKDQLAHIRDWGGQFIVPIPEPAIEP